MKDETISSWLKDPEFRALPEVIRQRKITNYFDSTYGDEEYTALPETSKDVVRSNFLKSQGFSIIPTLRVPQERNPIQNLIDRIGDIFTDKNKEKARSWVATESAQQLGITPSQAYDNIDETTDITKTPALDMSMRSMRKRDSIYQTPIEPPTVLPMLPTGEDVAPQEPKKYGTWGDMLKTFIPSAYLRSNIGVSGSVQMAEETTLGSIVASPVSTLQMMTSPLKRIGLTGIPEALEKVTNKIVKTFPSVSLSTIEYVLGMDKTLGEVAYDYWDKTAKEIEPNLEPSSFKSEVFGIMQNVAMNAPGLIASVLSRNPSFALAPMSIISGGQQYGQTRKEKPEISQAKALSGGLVSGAFEWLTELLPVSALINPKFGLVKKILVSAGWDVPGEEIATLVQDGIVGKETTNPEMTLLDFGKDVISTAIQSLGASLVMGAGAHSIQRLAEKAQGTPPPPPPAPTVDDFKNHLLDMTRKSLTAGKDGEGNPFAVKDVQSLIAHPDTKGLGLEDELNKIIIDHVGSSLTPGIDKSQEEPIVDKAPIGTSPIDLPIHTDEELWQITPDALQGTWEGMMEHVGEVAGGVEPQIQGLKDQLVAMKGTKGKEASATKKAIQKQIETLKALSENLNSHYEGLFLDRYERINNLAQKKAMELGIDEENTSNFLVDFSLAMSAPHYIQETHDKSVNDIFNTIIQGYLPEGDPLASLVEDATGEPVPPIIPAKERTTEIQKVGIEEAKQAIRTVESGLPIEENQFADLIPESKSIPPELKPLAEETVKATSPNQPFVDSKLNILDEWVRNGQKGIGTSWERGAVKRFKDAELKAAFSGKKYGEWVQAKIAINKSETFEQLREAINKLIPKAKDIKQPWEMTRKEFFASGKEIPGHPHIDYVREALSEGKPIPPEVLKDYPELVKEDSAVLGKNTEGENIYGDKNGVRYIVSNGIRIKETVSMIPTESGVVAQPRTPRDEQFEVVEKKAETTEGKAENVTPTLQIAKKVTAHLASIKTPIHAHTLFKWADEAHGGTQAEGKYTPKDAYDAMELGVNQAIEESNLNPATADSEQAKKDITYLRALVNNLPTQSKRTEETDKFQQFSTPPQLAYAVNWVANIQRGETYLEPSAGIGGLAVFGKIAGGKVVVNELSPRRREILKNLGFDQVFGENAEQLNNILSKDIQPTVIVMNPPFSATAGRLLTKTSKIGFDHIEQGLKRLLTNGRLVAILGSRITETNAFKKWFKGLGDNYTLRADISLSGKEYTKYGTTYGNQIIVIDKVSDVGKSPIKGNVDTSEELIDLLKGVRDERIIGEQIATQPKSEDVPEKSKGDTLPIKPVLPATGSVGVRERTKDRLQSRRVSKPDVNVAASQNDGVIRESEQKELSGEHRPSEREQDTEGSSVVDIGQGEGRIGSATGLESVEERIEVQKKETLKTKGALSDSVYETYTPQKINIPGSKEHPGKLVESAAMSAVEPPDPTYTPNLPTSIIQKGRLSSAQLETVVYAGQAHSEVLPTEERKGFFVGDGTGVGKGREIAGVLLDNWRQGRKKAIWVSQNSPLIEDARRDVKGIGWDGELVFDLGKTKIASQINAKEGIAFLGYDLLKSKDNKNKEISRLKQLVDWFGQDFDGVIVFDEAHNMGNALAVKGKRGSTRPSAKALTGVELQRLLPNARVLYVSATGATEVMNLSYADRLGLWGEGTPFADKRDFVDQISSGGIAAMELVARDMKAMGDYTARSLSYDDVKYERLDHTLTPQQRKVYNEFTEAWQIVLGNINAALDLTGGAKSGNAKMAAMSAFWGSVQRFFNQVITSIQMPSVVNAIEKDIKNGSSVILQIVNTNEAAQTRALSRMEEGDELEDLDLTPREQLMEYVKHSFPVAQYQPTRDEDGNIIYEPVLDSAGNPVENSEAVELREELLNKLGSVRGIDGPMEILLDHFGTEKVAEITGRTRRVVFGADEKGNKRKVIERRTKAKTMADADAFMNDKKPILIFSYAGGTGRSYHADLAAKNQRLRRHYLLQAGWRADRAIQGFGRSHRTNQKQAPEYILVTTDIIGQKRFISSIARRLDQLGALTRGQRQTGSGGFFTARDNFESIYAQDALDRLIQDIYFGKVPGMDMSEFMQQTGLTTLIDKKTGALNTSTLPPITQFLNRLLAMNLDKQVDIFNAFSDRMDENIKKAMETGDLDVGLETLKAKDIKKVGEQVIHTDKSRAQTKYVELDVTQEAKKLSFNDLKDSQTMGGFYRNIKSGHIYAIGSKNTRTDPNTGNLTDYHRLYSTKASAHNVNVEDINDAEKYEKIDEAQAKELWDAEYTALPDTVTYREHLITGTILPIWDRLAGKSRIMRVQTNDGERMIGRLIPPRELTVTLDRIGASASKQETSSKDIFHKVKDFGFQIELANGWKILRRKVSGENRIELRGPDYRNNDELVRHGVFTERIQWETRYFIPISEKEGISAIEAITANRPAVNAIAPIKIREDIGTEETSKDIGKGTKYSVEHIAAQDAEFSKQLDDYLSGKLKGGEPLKIGDTPYVLERLGAEQLPVVMNQSAVKKVLQDKHGLSVDILKQLPEQLNDPIMVFDSATQLDSFVVMTELQHEGKTIVATVHLSKKVGHHEVNNIASVYGKDSDGIFTKWINDGLLRYMNKKKSREWFQTRGLQLPKVETATRSLRNRVQSVTKGLQLPKVRGSKLGSNIKILFDHDIVKKYSTEGQISPTPTLDDVQKVFKGQEVIQPGGEDSPIYVKTRGGKYLTVENVNTISPNELEFEYSYGDKFDPDTMTISGAYGDGVVKLVRGVGGVWTLSHESTHFMEDTGIINAKDVAILKRHIRQAVRFERFKTANKNDIGGSEDRANFIADELTKNIPTKGVVGRVMVRIRDFLDRLMEAFGIKARTADSVVRDIKSGEILDRGSVEKGSSDNRYSVTKKLGAEEGTLDQAALKAQYDKMLKEARIASGLLQQNIKKEIPPNAKLLDDETRWQRLRRRMEDKNIRYKELMENLKKIGIDVPDNIDIYDLLDLLPRKTSRSALNIYEKKEIFVKDAVDRKVNLADVDLLARALHAEERNEAMKEKRADRAAGIEEGLSGMTDKEAAKVLEQFEDDKDTHEFAERVRQIAKDTLAFMYKNGLITKKEYSNLNNMYQMYVPLQRHMDDEDSFSGITSGQGISVTGKEYKQAIGSHREVISPISAVFQNAVNVTRRAVNAEIGRAIIKLVGQNPQLSKLFAVKKLPMAVVARIKDGETPIFRPRYHFAHDEIGTKINGIQYIIKIKDPLLARAAKNHNISSLPMLVKGLQTIGMPIKIMQRLVTQYRPDFLARNFMRDLGEALINLGVERGYLKEHGKALRREIAKDIFNSQREVYRELKKGNGNQMTKEFFADGGDIGHFWGESYEKAEKSLYDLERKFKNEGFEKVKNVVRAADELITDAQSAVELGIRLAAYKALRGRGFSREKAVKASSDLTINFARSGEWSAVFKNLYMFFGPAIQGSSKTIRTMASPYGRKVTATTLAAITAAGFVTGILAALIGGDDDDKISEFAKNTSVTFAIKGHQLTFWILPYGYTTFFALGSNLAQIAMDKKSPLEGVSSLLGVAFGSFSPIGGAGPIHATTFAPSLVKPLLEIATNVAWHGGKIHPEQVFDMTPGYSYKQYTANAPAWSIATAEYIKKLTGVDASPNDYDYAFRQYFGGAYEMAYGVPSAMYKMADKGELELGKIPIVKQGIRELKADSFVYKTISDTRDVAGKRMLTELEAKRFQEALDMGRAEGVIDGKTRLKYKQEVRKGQRDVKLEEETGRDKVEIKRERNIRRKEAREEMIREMKDEARRESAGLLGYGQ